MHPIMRKTGKAEQQVKDLSILNASQSFLDGSELVASTMDKYEKIIYDMAEKLGEAVRNNPAANLTTLFTIKELPFPAHTCVGVNIAAMQQEWIGNLLIIHCEVHRKPNNNDDMIHDEYMKIGEFQKAEKAAKGRAVINNSTAGAKRQRKNTTNKVLLFSFSL